MAKNDFLARQEQMKQAYFDAGEEIGIQKVWDAVQQALRDPEVVGKDKWGRKRLEKLFKKTKYFINYYHEAFTMSPEADVKQEEQDKCLQEIWGEDLVPHKDRYPYCKEFSYKKSRKEWR